MTGIQPENLRVVIYGPEGIGKTSLAALFPKPLFIDTECGTAQLNVSRVYPQSWSALTQALAEFEQNPKDFKTFAMDTADAADKMCREHVCAEAGVKAIGDADFGAVYQKLCVEWARMLDVLQRIAKKVHVVLVAHSQIVHCEIPGEIGVYDKYELKLMNSFKVNLAAMTKEWANLVMFVSFETYLTQTKGDFGKKQITAQGGKQVIHCRHHPCWDAKQRTGFDLPEKMDFPEGKLPDELASLIERSAKPISAKDAPAPESEPASAQKTEKKTPPKPTGVKVPEAEAASLAPVVDPEKAPLLAQLRELMTNGKVSMVELDGELARKGVVPTGTLPPAYNVETLKRIVTNWSAVQHNIEIHRAS